MSRSYKKRYDNTSYRIHFKRSHFQDAKAAYLYIDKSITGALANEYIAWHNWFVHLTFTECLQINLEPIDTYYYAYHKYDNNNGIEEEYRDRTRHTSLQYPHYTSAYEDVISSASRDKWRHTRKPNHCCRKVK